MKILYFFGDSTTLGVGDMESGGWPVRLTALLSQEGLFSSPDTIYNLGVRKDSSDMIAKRWKKEFNSRVIERTQACLLFCFGTVDAAAPHGSMNIPVGESAANARTILVNASQAGKTIFISPFPVRDDAHRQRIETLCTAYSSICKAINVPYIDIFHQLNCPQFLDDLADGVHPEAVGNQLIATLLAANSCLKDICRTPN